MGCLRVTAHPSPNIKTDNTGIQEAEWEFRTTVDASTLHQHKGHVDLICEGLDTYCDVYLVRLTSYACDHCVSRLMIC